VVGERPITLAPRAQVERTPTTGQVVELTAFLRFADLAIDRVLPVLEFADRPPRWR
jgi:hypothetical protein